MTCLSRNFSTWPPIHTYQCRADPPPPLKDIMTLHDSLQSMGRKHARPLELERLQQWRRSMGQE